MLKKTVLVFLCLSLFLSIPGCNKKLPTSPDIPDTPTREASFILVSSTQGYTSYGCCEITGTVKNVGQATGYNVMIEFQAYNANNTIIDTASGFPADLGNIPVGVSATFDAVFFELYNWNVIAKTTYEITWLTAQGTKLTQTGFVFFK